MRIKPSAHPRFSNWQRRLAGSRQRIDPHHFCRLCVIIFRFSRPNYTARKRRIVASVLQPFMNQLDLQPDPFELLEGSPRVADVFLLTSLWNAPSPDLRPETVIAWAKMLHSRGESFASHSAVCHYWLYEHYAGYEHVCPALPPDLRTRSLGGP
jgi:hypothetical protein